MTLPAGWTVTPASAKWDGKSGLSSDSAEVDQFLGPASATSGVANPYAKKLLGYVLDLIHWNYKYHGDTCPPTPESQTPVKIGGVPGMLLQGRHAARSTKARTHHMIVWISGPGPCEKRYAFARMVKRQLLCH